MTITDQDVSRIARLARIELRPESRARIQNEFTGILALIRQLQAADTSGVEPMSHPLEAHQDVRLRLRDDTAAPAQTLAERDQLMANAPARDQGLFLVPTVIE